MSDHAKADLLRLIVRLAESVPPAALEKVCAGLDAEPTSVSPNDLSRSLEHVAHPALRADLKEILRRSADGACALSIRELAWALRAAAVMGERPSSGRLPELVWTGPAPPTGVLRQTAEALLETIESARTDLWLVTFAGYKVPALQEALLASAARGVSIRLVVESPEASEGKITFSALEALGKAVADRSAVYVWPLDRRTKDNQGRHGSLHAKCALADDEVLFVSSANLTGYALALNMELGVLIRGGEIPRRLSNHLRWLVEQSILAPTRPT